MHYKQKKNMCEWKWSKPLYIFHVMDSVTNNDLVGLCRPNEKTEKTLEKVSWASHLIHWLCCACCSVEAVICVCSSCSSGLCSNFSSAVSKRCELCKANWATFSIRAAIQSDLGLNAERQVSLKKPSVWRIENRVLWERRIRCGPFVFNSGAKRVRRR